MSSISAAADENAVFHYKMRTKSGQIIGFQYSLRIQFFFF